MDQVAIGIEGAKTSGLVESHVGLNSLQCLFGHEKCRLQRAVMAPEPHGAQCAIVIATPIGKAQCHRPAPFQTGPVACISAPKPSTTDALASYVRARRLPTPGT